MRNRTFFLLIACVLSLSALTSAQTPPTASPQVLVPEVVNVYPHDPNAFTQGLLWHDGKLYESTGLRGESSLREVDLTTGEVLRRVDVTRPASELSAGRLDYFAEGLERVGDTLIQLTWTEGEAFVYDLATFERINTFTYEGEGWGLCYDGKHLYMSDSTQFIDLRDPITFELIVSFAVTLNGSLLNPQLLNELECVGDDIYANLWQTDYIVQIDKFNGVVKGVIDASGLLTAEERLANLRRDRGAVLNGIAYNPETDTFFITGKKWENIYEVRFVPKEGQ
jgi:glutamine cyclotransferase